MSRKVVRLLAATTILSGAYCAALVAQGKLPTSLFGLGTTIDSVVIVSVQANLPLVKGANGASAHRLGYYAVGDGGNVDYLWNSNACSVNGGLGDNATQVPASAGGCWVANLNTRLLRPQMFGMKGDAITDNTPAFNNLIAAFNAMKGGRVEWPAGIFNVCNTPAASHLLGYWALIYGGTWNGAGVPGAGGGGGTITDDQLTGSSVIRNTCNPGKDLLRVVTGQPFNFTGIMIDNLAPHTAVTTATLTGTIGATFVGSTSGLSNMLTVSSVTGYITTGDYIPPLVAGITRGTIVVQQVSGTPGGAGVYRTNIAANVTSASMSVMSRRLHATAVSGMLDVGNVLTGAGVSSTTAISSMSTGTGTGTGVATGVTCGMTDDASGNPWPLCTGVGGVGTYNLSVMQTVASPVTMTATYGGADLVIAGVAGSQAYNRGSRIENAMFRGSYTAIRGDYAQQASLHGNMFLDYAQAAVVSNNDGLPGYSSDEQTFGDIDASNFAFDLNVTTGTAYSHLFGAFGKISLTAYSGAWGVLVNYCGRSEELRIEAASLQNHTQGDIGLFQACPGSDIAEVIIADNHLGNQMGLQGQSGPAHAEIFIAKGTPSATDVRWFRQGNVVNNTFNGCFNNVNGADSLIHIEDGDGVIVADNNANMNYNPNFLMPCGGLLDGAGHQGPYGIAFLHLEGAGLAGTTAGGVGYYGIVNGKISNNVWANASGPYLSGNCPMCDFDGDNGIRTTSMTTSPSGEAWGKRYQIIRNLTSVTGFAQIAALSPSVVASLSAGGVIDATLEGYTHGVGTGLRKVSWAYSYNGGAPSVAMVSDTGCVVGTACPQFKLVTSGNSVVMQVASSDGSSAIDGGQITLDLTTPVPAGQLNDAFYWSVY